MRNRQVLNLVVKRLKFSPVVAIQGARQTGKSVLVRDILTKSLKKAKYVTLDSRTEADFAQNNPESFLSSHDEDYPLIIDEAQKAPAIFDAVKFSVDTNRRPGRYLLLGSTEFSHLTRVRESLTGRMGRIRLYPFTLSETHNLNLRALQLNKLFLNHARVTRAQLIKHLSVGGMPGFFSVRDEAERFRLLQDWLELTCRRDVMQMRGVKVDSELCFLILEQIAKLDEPSAGLIAKNLLRDLRKVKTHLDVLETLFVIQKVSPHVISTGKEIYYLMDVALAKHLGASFFKCLLTLVKTELDALIAYHDATQTRMTYFQTRSGGNIHFILENAQEMAAIKILGSESLDMRELLLLLSFQNKAVGKKLYCYALGGARFSLAKEKIEVYPWESLA